MKKLLADSELKAIVSVFGRYIDSLAVAKDYGSRFKLDKFALVQELVKQFPERNFKLEKSSERSFRVKYKCKDFTTVENPTKGKIKCSIDHNIFEVNFRRGQLQCGYEHI